MHGQELRRSFLAFFEQKGHVIVPSSSLIPDDPSVLLTTAGMQQFKPYYTGELDPMNAIHGVLGKPLGSHRVSSAQKSFRTSDLDTVGDESHLTFFEMLGNFSFGYEPGVSGLSEKGYFKNRAIEWAWEFVRDVLGIDEERMHVSIFEGDHEVPADTEARDIWKSIHVHDSKIVMGNRRDNFWGPTGNEGPCGPTTEIYVDGIEVWNLVFNEYYMHSDKRLEPLKAKGVDTGMGLERLALVMQFPGHPEKSIFATDLFFPLIELLPREITERNKRIIVDHIRGAAFLIADGVRPSNKEVGYVLRRLLRRALTYGYLGNINVQVFNRMLDVIAEKYGPDYSEVERELETMKQVLGDEEDKFGKTLSRGLKELNSFQDVSAEAAFRLYESYGLPFEVIKELGGERAAMLTHEMFDFEFKRHQQISRAGVGHKFGGHGLNNVSLENARTDPSLWKMTRLHTATHLLHQALRDILGKEVRQMGSDINVDRARFDFTFGRKVTAEEIDLLETEINRKIKADLSVKKEMMPYQSAIASGAIAFFKEKYPESVSVYSIGDFSAGTGEAYSKELCGGPHVATTKEIGNVKILKEEGVSAGVRRIRIAVG